jgi:hypothetical protein
MKATISARVNYQSVSSAPSIAEVHPQRVSDVCHQKCNAKCKVHPPSVELAPKQSVA